MLNQMNNKNNNRNHLKSHNWASHFGWFDFCFLDDTNNEDERANVVLVGGFREREKEKTNWHTHKRKHFIVEIKRDLK